MYVAKFGRFTSPTKTLYVRRGEEIGRTMFVLNFPSPCKLWENECEICLH